MKAKLNDAQARAYIAGDPSEPAQEIERNPRARSAMLRGCEKLETQG